jgi:ATP-dependent DNA helicase RecG
MCVIKSKIQPNLSLDYILNGSENKLFDRKSVKIRPADLAPLISAFANAEGGTIVIGINEKTREIEGVNSLGPEKLNNLITAPKDCCKPMPRFTEEFLSVRNHLGQEDSILLLHIESCPDQVIRTASDQTYLRIGDKTRQLLGDDLRNLEYSKSIRHFEDECNLDASLEDLDPELLQRYKEILQADDLSFEQILKARGFIKTRDGSDYLTNAAVLLFASNVQRFYPNCRIRFIRYDGTKAGTGMNINIIKDYSIDLPLLRIINSAKDYISAQLRDFMAMDPKTGRFQTVPEYPEFAWLEGIVNAVTHREYALAGDYIKVTMFDDRLEIQSPGKLPNLVTIDNIKETRYPRNPRISRVLTDFGWVRELNEGVKRIYSDMAEFFLDDPIYSEPEQAVRLVLKNNIVMRNMRRQDRAIGFVGEGVWAKLDDLDHNILTVMASRSVISRAELAKYTDRANRTITVRLNKLIERGIVKANGNSYDPKRTYSIVYE